MELKERRRRQRRKVYQYADYKESKDKRCILLKTFKYESDCIEQTRKPRTVKLIPLIPIIWNRFIITVPPSMLFCPVAGN